MLDIYTENNHGDFVKNYDNHLFSFHMKFLQKKSQYFIFNIETQFLVMAKGSHAWLVTVNNAEYKNAMTCSPYATYISYPKEIVSKMNNIFLKSVVFLFPRLFGFFFKLAKINKVAQVNNNLISSANYDDNFQKNFKAIFEFLKNHFLQHAIILPRVNQIIDTNFSETLKNSGFIFIKDKYTHLFDPKTSYINHTDLKKDLSLLEETDYSVVKHDELTQEDLLRVFELYQSLFISKHTQYNPDLTINYFEYSHKFRWSEYIALRNKKGIIDAFTSWTIKDNLMIATGCGYDLEKPRKIGLYRMITALGLKYAYENNYFYNHGGGSDQFKLNRGSKKVSEYTAVYCAHLPFYRQLPWRMLAWFSENVITRIHSVNKL